MATAAQLYPASALAETSVSISHSGHLWKGAVTVQSKQIPALLPDDSEPWMASATAIPN